MTFKKGKRAPQTFEQCLNWYEAVTTAAVIREMVSPMSAYLQKMSKEEKKKIMIKALTKRYGDASINNCKKCNMIFFTKPRFRRHMLFWHNKYIK